MKQSRAFSLLEALSNVAVGLLVAMGTQLVVFHLLGIAVSTGETVIITCAFTAVSILRSYALRRLFETLRVRREHRARSRATTAREAGHGW
jgi:uncharacterized membrane protein